MVLFKSNKIILSKNTSHKLRKNVCNLSLSALTSVTKHYLRVIEALIIEIWSLGKIVTQNYVCMFTCVCVCVYVCVLLLAFVHMTRYRRVSKF